MPRRSDSPLELLAKLPWWVSIGLFFVVFVALRFVFPATIAKHPIGQSLANASYHLAWIALVFLATAAVSVWESRRKRELLDRQRGIDTIRALSWREFEELLGEAYRRQGYSVIENSSAGPDGGIDLVIERSSARYLVQCKQWRKSKVPVSVVREMFGLVHAEQADGAIIVTSGMFTQEACNFAADKPIELVGESQLIDLVRTVQTAPTAKPDADESSTSICPDCGHQLVMRTARRGSKSGSKFWGCSAYPKCRFTKNLNSLTRSRE